MDIIYIHHIFYAADYTLIFILVCQWRKWISAMAMDFFLISHFLSFGKTGPAEIKNEILLFVLGVAFGILGWEGIRITSGSLLLFIIDKI